MTRWLGAAGRGRYCGPAAPWTRVVGPRNFTVEEHGEQFSAGRQLERSCHFP